MERTKFFPPYYVNARGTEKCTMKDCSTCSQAGVYFIKSLRSGTIVYVGQSQTQLKKTIYRHFQKWTDKQNGKKFERKVYKNRFGYQIRFIKCTPAQALKLERYFIQKLKPKDNPLKYEIAFGADEVKKVAPLAAEANASDWIPKNRYQEEEAPF